MRRGIHLEDKYRVVQALREGRPHSQVAAQFQMGRSTVSGIWKKRDVILRAYEEHRPKAKRLRPSSNDAVDRALFTWFRAQVNSGDIVGGPVLRRKAEEIARKLGDESFVCSLGWLDRFKVRHGISFSKMKETSGESDKKSFEHKFWPGVRGDFRDEDIFAVKETGLYFKSGPEEAKGMYGKVCDTGEDAEKRLTVCLCANMTGTEKRRLLVVGNSPSKGESFPVRYRANRKSWMDMDISNEELVAWEEELSEKNRRVLVLVQFSPAFRTFGNFQHITLGYLPSAIEGHPLDNAVNFMKTCYRMYVLDHLYRGDGKELNLSYALRMLSKAWTRTSKGTVTGGFRILFKKESQTGKNVPSLSEWASKQGFPPSVLNLDMDQYQSFDDALVTSVHFTSDAADTRESLAFPDSGEIPEEPNKESPSCEEALKAIGVLYSFFEGRPGNSCVLDSIARVEISVEDISTPIYNSDENKDTHI